MQIAIIRQWICEGGVLYKTSYDDCIDIHEFINRFDGKPDDEALSPEAVSELMTILASLLAKLTGDSAEIIAKGLAIVGKYGLFQEGFIWIKKINDINFSLQLLQQLEKDNQLNLITLLSLINCQFPHRIAELLALMDNLHIPYDAILFEKICLNPNLYFIIEILSGIKPQPDWINSETMAMLLDEHFTFFIDKNPVFKLLREYCNEELFHLIYSYKSIFFFHRLVKILSKHQLLQSNEKLLIPLLRNTIPLNDFYFLIDYLEESDTLVPLFTILKEVSFEKVIKYVDDLLSLSKQNRERLSGLIYKLAAAHILTIDTFEKAFQRVSLKLPENNEISVIKISRKESGQPRSEMIVIANAPSLRFFLEHDPTKHYKKGTFGKIKRGYDKPAADSPVYSVKQLLADQLTVHGAQNEAKREVKFNLLLGRQAFYFTRQGKTSIVSEWLHKKALFYFKPEELRKESYEKRLHCLLTALSEMNTLHAYFCVHGDIKANNIILDLENASMRLIDFGTARKNQSKKKFAWTAFYSDPSLTQEEDYSFCDDIYAMSIVMAYLFPELFSIQLRPRDTMVTIIKYLSLTSLEEAIIKLLLNMRTGIREERCSSEEAVHFCQEILRYGSQLDAVRLNTISNSTLYRTDMTAEDVFRGISRTSFAP